MDIREGGENLAKSCFGCPLDGLCDHRECVVDLFNGLESDTEDTCEEPQGTVEEEAD
jgi:hypothetical protein